MSLHQGRQFDPTPVRRLYKQQSSSGSGVRNAAETTSADAGNSHDDMSASIELGTSSANALKDTSFGLGQSYKPAPPANTTQKSYFFQSKGGPGKNAPARVKANPISGYSGRPGSRGGNPRALEPIPTQPVDPSQSGWLATLNMDFEKQLQEIERLNLKENTLAFTAQNDQESKEEEPPEVPKETTDSKRIGKPIHVPYTPDLRARPTLATSLHTHVSAKPMVLRDYQLLAEACQRAGKARMEGHAYYKTGEMLACNRETLTNSIKYFKKYLNICRRLNDLQGEAKALNCLGIAHQELGGNDHLEAALEYHRQHSEISDAAGIFIANTNMGLIHGKLDNWNRAIEHHKQALQYAVRAGDRQAESLALANLGLMGRSQGDLGTAKVCMERHLELARSLADDTAATQANEQLGLLAVEKGDWGDSAKLLNEAMDLSMKHNDQAKSNELKCLLGVVNGNLKMEEHIRTLSRNMGAKVEKKQRKQNQEQEPSY